MPSVVAYANSPIVPSTITPETQPRALAVDAEPQSIRAVPAAISALAGLPRRRSGVAGLSPSSVTLLSLTAFAGTVASLAGAFIENSRPPGEANDAGVISLAVVATVLGYVGTVGLCHVARLRHGGEGTSDAATVFVPGSGPVTVAVAEVAASPLTQLAPSVWREGGVPQPGTNAQDVPRALPMVHAYLPFDIENPPPEAS